MAIEEILVTIEGEVGKVHDECFFFIDFQGGQLFMPLFEVPRFKIIRCKENYFFICFF